MPSNEPKKPLSRQERRLEERKKGRSGSSSGSGEASPAAKGNKQSETEKGKHRAQLRAAALGGRLPAGAGAGRATNNIIPISRGGPLSSAAAASAGQPTSKSPFTRMRARQTFASGKELAEYFGVLDVEEGAASLETRHSFKNELDLLKAAFDAVGQADEKTPLYYDFLEEVRGKCVDVSAQMTKVVDGKQVAVKTPLILRTKDAAMVEKVEKCVANLETTVDVWEILFQRLGESMAYWRSPRQDVGKRVAEPQQLKLRRDLQLTQDRLETCIREMLGVHELVSNFMDGIKRGLGQAINMQRKGRQDWEEMFAKAAEQKGREIAGGSGNGNERGDGSGTYPATL